MMMRETTVAPERGEKRIKRKDLFNSLVIGFLLGLVGGTPIGWFAHRFYAQQRTAQVLLCRQQNYGLSEADLQARCGYPY